MSHNKRSVVIFMIVAVSSTLISQQLISTLQAYASESSPYQSGYDHGCDDAGISDPGDRYINQPEKGPSFHTGEFMSGYNAGFGQCGSNERGGGDEGNGQSGGPSTADKQDFCTAYNRGDLDDLQDLARDFGLGSVNAAARLWCSLTGSN